MKRPVVFLLLGPSLVALAVWMVAAAIAGRIDDSFIGVCAITAFLLTLPVAAITGLVDGYLARGLPTLLRAFLTAAFGMTIAIGLVLALFTVMFSRTVPPEIMNGALCAGFFLPRYVLKKLIKRRQRLVQWGLADALDLMVVSIEAGLGLSAAITCARR